MFKSLNYEYLNKAKSPCLSKFIFQLDSDFKLKKNFPFPIGIIEGEGVGLDLLQASLKVLSALETVTTHSFEIIYSNNVGRNGKNGFKEPLDPDLISFCEKIFNFQGGILAGPGGGRFVYSLRRQFDLFCKLNLVKPFPALKNIGRLKYDYLKNVDIVIVRENVAGLYFGEINSPPIQSEHCRLEYSFSYSLAEVKRIIKIAAEIAASRKGKLMVVTKEGGVPEISQLWRQCTEEIASEIDIEYTISNIDYAAYYLIQHAQEVDVMVAPNLFGDVLVDVSALLLGSRGLSYSANYASSGASVYQTNHGAAFDLVGKDAANPVAQIMSMTMMLRENFGLVTESLLIEQAINQVWAQGYRTADIIEPGCTIIGTQEMAERIADTVVDLVSNPN